MLLGPLAVASLLVLADWGLWEWAIANDHGTFALIAGLAMAPLVVLFAFYALLVAAALVSRALARAHGELRGRTARPRLRPAPAPAGDLDAPEERRLAA